MKFREVFYRSVLAQNWSHSTITFWAFLLSHHWALFRCGYSFFMWPIVLKNLWNPFVWLLYAPELYSLWQVQFSSQNNCFRSSIPSKNFSMNVSRTFSKWYYDVVKPIMHWKHMLSDVKNPRSKANCEKTNELIEISSKIVIFVCTYVIGPCVVSSKAIISFYIYFTTDAGSDAFDLPIPMWWVLWWMSTTSRAKPKIIYFKMHCMINSTDKVTIRLEESNGIFGSGLHSVLFGVLPWPIHRMFHLPHIRLTHAHEFIHHLSEKWTKFNQQDGERQKISEKSAKIEPRIYTLACKWERVESIICLWAIKIMTLLYCRLARLFSDLCEIMLTIVFVGCLVSISTAMLLFQIEMVEHLFSFSCIDFMENGHIYIALSVRSHTMKLIYSFNWRRSFTVLRRLAFCHLFVSLVRCVLIDSKLQWTSNRFLIVNLMQFKFACIREWAILLKESRQQFFRWIGICSQTNYSGCCKQLYKVDKSRLLLNALEMCYVHENNWKKWVDYKLCSSFTNSLNLCTTVKLILQIHSFFR